MNQSQFDSLISPTQAKQLWLKSIAETSIAHKRFIEQNPGELTEDDLGLNEIENGFLYLYGLALKNGWIEQDDKGFDS